MNPRHDLLRYPSFDYAFIWVPPRLPLLLTIFYVMAAKFVSKLVFSQDDVANSERLEPAFECQLRSLMVNDSVIDALRVNEVTVRALFKDLAQDVQQLKNCAEAFGIVTSEAAEFPHQREMAKIIGAWRHKVNSKPQPTQRQEPTGASDTPIHGLEQLTFGPDLCDNELPAKSCYEDFEESLAECSLEAERLRDVVSEEEARDQRKLKADPARQYGMHLDGKLTLRTRREFTSPEPANQEQIRAKYCECCRTCGSWRRSGNQAGRSSGISPKPLSMTTCAFFSIAGISTTARKLTDSCCHSRTTLWIRCSAPLGTRVCRLTQLRCPRLVCLPCSHLPWLLV